MRRTRVIAHRGSSATHADNSWAAFEAAVVEGADVIECDAQTTRDGVLVIRHDLEIDNQRVADLDLAELESLTPGIVILADLLSWAARARIDLLVEVKDPDASRAIASMVAGSVWRDRVVVGSFHGPAMAEVKATSPAVRTSLLVGSVMAAEELAHLAAAYLVDGVHLCWEARSPQPHQLLDRATVEQLRRAGLDITLWHEEREDELRELVALQPDAICTNTPAVLRHIVDAYSNRPES